MPDLFTDQTGHYSVRESKPDAGLRWAIYSDRGLVPVCACRTEVLAEEVRDFLAERAIRPTTGEGRGGE